MSIALYPGSFNPWHEGHYDIIHQALKIFNKIIIVQCINPEKEKPDENNLPWYLIDKYGERIDIIVRNNLIRDIVRETEVDCIIKGLRNTQDFEYEKIQQYWNEDLGVTIPTMYIISDRKLVHISSSAIKQVEKFK